MKRLTQIINDDDSMLAIALIGGLTLVSFSTDINGHTWGLISHPAWLVLSASWCTAWLSHLHGRKEAGRTRHGAHTDVYLMRICYFLLIAGVTHAAAFNYVHWDTLLLAIHQGLLFGIIFDPVRNKYANQPFFYAGTEAWHDGISIKAPRLFFAIEIILLVGLSLFFVLNP